jgi:hypothetical protein
VAANSAAHRSIRQLNDLSQDLVAQIEHFFVSYNEMKSTRFDVKGRAGSTRASRARHGSHEGDTVVERLMDLAAERTHPAHATTDHRRSICKGHSKRDKH